MKFEFLLGNLKINDRQLPRFIQRLVRKKLAIVCILALLVLYTCGIFAECVSPYGYTDQDYSSILQSPNSDHWAGTDRTGRDVLTRTLWGVQNTLILTVVAMLTGGLVIGVTLGLLAGYMGGKTDGVIMRIGEIFASFPDILLVIILAATLRPRILELARWVEDSTAIDGLVRTGIVDYFVVSFALVAFGWVGMARLVRGQILALREADYIQAARAIGASTKRILFFHLLPNCISVIVVTVSMGMGALTGTEIVLSWLGLGIQPPRPSLGTMLLGAGNIGTLRDTPWELLVPGIAAFIMVVAWNLLGDALSDALNPKTR
ncbi:MAG: peptide ABC transporter permease [Dehalococcoidia bacterium]|nr:peptide ABC transporter permease [Dehalococcoidia bacterium]MQG16535.1 ABC transporter permease [SAR202 cluster bacterium]